MPETYSPSGAFIGLTRDELETLKATALDRIANGAFTALSGGGKSSTQDYGLSPQAILLEVQYALNILNRTPRVSAVVYDVNQRGGRYA